MAGSETIREFLVSLGFKTDETSLKKFSNGIADATKSVLKLAATIEATALAIAFGVNRFADNMEQLYFASKRTGASVSALKALDVSAQNFGASAGEALSNVEALAEMLRSDPSTEGRLAGWGVQVKHFADGTVDAEDAFLQLSKALQSNSYFFAKQIASQFGVTDNMLRYLRDPRYAEDLARIQREMPGGFNDAAEGAHRFKTQIRDLSTVFEAFGAQVMDALQRKLGVSLQGISKWLDAHGDETATWIIHAATVVGRSAELIVNGVESIVTAYEHLLDKATAVGQFFADHAPTHLVDMVGDSINDMLHFFGLINDEDYERQHKYYEQEYTPGNKDYLHSSNNPGNLRFAGQSGAARGAGGFAAFRTPLEGLTALGKQLELYGTRDHLTTVADIISKYAPPGENDTAGYINSVSKYLGVDKNRQLDLTSPQIVEGLIAGITRQEGNSAGVNPELIYQAAQAATRPYRAGGIADTDFGQYLLRLGNHFSAVNAANHPATVTINVSGAGSPEAVAKRVKESLARTNSQTVRGAAQPVQ